MAIKITSNLQKAYPEKTPMVDGGDVSKVIFANTFRVVNSKIRFSFLNSEGDIEDEEVSLGNIGKETIIFGLTAVETAKDDSEESAITLANTETAKTLTGEIKNNPNNGFVLKYTISGYRRPWFGIPEDYDQDIKIFLDCDMNDTSNWVKAKDVAFSGVNYKVYVSRVQWNMNVDFLVRNYG